MEWEGVADLRERRAKVAPTEWKFDELLASVARRFRWLRFVEKLRPTEEDDVDFELFLADGNALMGWAGHYSRLDEAWIHDPFWLLDALAGADERTTHAGEDFVGGFLCKRYTFVSDLKAAQAAAPGPFHLPPHGRVERPTIRGEVWIDGDGLVRQVNWRQPFRRRPRLPVAKEPATTTWHRLELWDFGLQVEIDAPQPGSPAPAR